MIGLNVDHLFMWFVDFRMIMMSQINRNYAFRAGGRATYFYLSKVVNCVLLFWLKICWMIKEQTQVKIFAARNLRSMQQWQVEVQVNVCFHVQTNYTLLFFCVSFLCAWLCRQDSCFIYHQAAVTIANRCHLVVYTKTLLPCDKCLRAFGWWLVYYKNLCFAYKGLGNHQFSNHYNYSSSSKNPPHAMQKISPNNLEAIGQTNDPKPAPTTGLICI